MNIDERRQLNVKVPPELWEELDKTDLPRQKIVIDALNLYFHRDLQTEHSSEKDLRSEIEYLRSENTKLLALLNQAQVLQLQTHKLLQEPVKDEPEHRPWWMFWKK